MYRHILLLVVAVWRLALADPPPPDRMSLESALDFYSPARLARVWKEYPDEANSTCFENMATFLSDLSEGKIWALHAADASGRYGGGFLWGNGYWLGSNTHCSHIEPPPPFRLGFFVMRTKLGLSGYLHPILANKTDQMQTTFIGVCLPFACSAEDSIEILQRSINSSRLEGMRTVSLVVEKSPHARYNMYEDPVFWLLIGITVIVVILAFVGTALELYEDYNLEKRKITKYVYDNYTYEIAKTPEVITAAVKIPAGANNNENSEAESSERNSVNSEEMTGKIFAACFTTRIWKDILLAFSLKRNLITICERSVGEDTIPTIHGLRSISMAWVILGHTCIVAFKYSDNMHYRSIVERELVFQTVNKGAYSVDTFFFISGLLVSFLYFRTTAKHDITKITNTTGLASNFLEFLGLITYRFARLTTPYFFILGVVQVTMKWFYHNSVFEPPTMDHINCPQYWWRNLLYINTLFPVQEMCMLWSWYLADDTQFYVLGVILLIMAVKHFKVAATLMTVFLVSSWGTTAMIAYTNNHVPK